MKVLLAALSMLALCVCPAVAQSNGASWRYTLLDASTLTDDCPICGRPTIPYPLRGTFDLVLVSAGPLFTDYRLTNISLTAGSQPLYTVSGSGTYRFGGEVAVQQEMLLQTVACQSTLSCRDVSFTNADRIANVLFPLIDVSLVQTQASSFSVYTLRIVAAPVREIWFTTPSTFTTTNGNVIHAGDILSSLGRSVRLNTNLLTMVGVTNPSPTLHVDAFDMAPGGEIMFSLNEDAVSSTLGPLHHGDLLSNRGRIVKTNQQLTAAFGLPAPAPDVGLDAVFVTTNGEILFSIRTNIFVEGKGFALRHGDVLSSTGGIFKANEQLLARFHPPESFAPMDYGLDALHVWPNGEVWFSLATGFDDSELGTISDGDLLSSEGRIVFHNAELVSSLGAPQGSNFGLSDIFVVSDAVVAGAPRLFPPRLSSPVIQAILLRWAGSNRVFQLESATNVTGVWSAPLGIDPDTSLLDGRFSPRKFYRVRGW